MNSYSSEWDDFREKLSKQVVEKSGNLKFDNSLISYINQVKAKIEDLNPNDIA